MVATNHGSYPLIAANHGSHPTTTNNGSYLIPTHGIYQPKYTYVTDSLGSLFSFFAANKSQA